MNKKKYYYQQIETNKISKIKMIESIKELLHKNKLSKALATVDRYLEDYPNDPYGLFQHANILLLLGYIDEAKKEFLNIVEQNLDTKYSSLYKLGVIAKQENDYDLACKYFRQNIEESPYAEIFSIIELSNIVIYQKNDVEEALAVLYKYSDMKDENILLQKANILIHFGNCIDAYEVITKELSLENTENKLNEKQKYYYYRIKGISEFYLKKYDDSIKSLSTSLSYCSNNDYCSITIKQYIAQSYYKLRDFKSTIEICNEIIQFGESNSVGESYKLLGNVYKDLGYYDEAETSYNYSEKSNINLANLNMLRKNYEEAVTNLTEYIDKNENNKKISSIYLRRSILYFKLGEIKKANSDFNHIIKRRLSKKDKEHYEALKTNLDFKNTGKINSDNYELNQLLNYSFEALKSQLQQQYLYQNDKSTYFNQNIDFDELICQIPELLDKAKIVENVFYEVYEVPYENIGYVDGEKSDTLGIKVFPDTKKVYMMYPIKSKNIYDMDKSTEKLKNMSKSKVYEQKSRVDKFNQKYGLKSEI